MRHTPRRADESPSEPEHPIAPLALLPCRDQSRLCPRPRDRIQTRIHRLESITPMFHGGLSGGLEADQTVCPIRPLPLLHVVQSRGCVRHVQRRLSELHRFERVGRLRGLLRQVLDC